MSLTQHSGFAWLRCCLGDRVEGHAYNPLSPAVEESDMAIPCDHQTTIWGWLVQLHWPWWIGWVLNALEPQVRSCSAEEPSSFRADLESLISGVRDASAG